MTILDENYTRFFANRDSYLLKPKRMLVGSRRFCIDLLERYARDVGHAITVLDYGCGEAGSLCFFGERNGVTVEGYDYDAKCLASKYKSLGELEGKHFDWIVLIDSIEHMKPEVAIPVLEWCAEHADNVFLSTMNHYYCPWVNFFCDLTHDRPYNVPDVNFVLMEHRMLANVYWCDWLSWSVFNPFKWLYNLCLGKTFLMSHVVVARRQEKV